MCSARLTKRRASGAQFLYERTHEGLREGLIFELDPDALLRQRQGPGLCGRRADGRASTSGASLKQFRILPLIAVKGKILQGRSGQHHPASGGAAETVRDGEQPSARSARRRLSALRDGYARRFERLAGLQSALGDHRPAPLRRASDRRRQAGHAGRSACCRSTRKSPTSDLIWIANEGIRVSALVESLRASSDSTMPSSRESWSRCSRPPPIRCACSPRARKCRLPLPWLLRMESV